MLRPTQKATPNTAGALESRARIDGTDRGPDYSEQQLIDCVTPAAGYNSFGCAGGTAGEAEFQGRVPCAAQV